MFFRKSVCTWPCLAFLRSRNRATTCFLLCGRRSRKQLVVVAVLFHFAETASPSACCRTVDAAEPDEGFRDPLSLSPARGMVTALAQTREKRGFFCVHLHRAPRGQLLSLRLLSVDQGYISTLGVFLHYGEGASGR